MARLPVELDVSIPVRSFRVRNLLALEPSHLIESGWGHGDDEIFSDEQAIAWFDVADVVKAGARLDWDKLNHVNNHYIREQAAKGALTSTMSAPRRWQLTS